MRYRYAPDIPEVLRGLNLEIRRGDRIGLIGSTGSGKTTLVDLLMGLLVPTGGRVLVDGQDLHDPAMQSAWLDGWQRSLTYLRVFTG